MEEAGSSQLTVESLTTGMLIVNFAAIQASSLFSDHVLVLTGQHLPDIFHRMSESARQS